MVLPIFICRGHTFRTAIWVAQCSKETITMAIRIITVLFNNSRPLRKKEVILLNLMLLRQVVRRCSRRHSHQQQLLLRWLGTLLTAAAAVVVAIVTVTALLNRSNIKRVTKSFTLRYVRILNFKKLDLDALISLCFCISEATSIGKYDHSITALGVAWFTFKHCSSFFNTQRYQHDPVLLRTKLTNCWESYIIEWWD